MKTHFTEYECPSLNLLCSFVKIYLIPNLNVSVGFRETATSEIRPKAQVASYALPVNMLLQLINVFSYITYSQNSWSCGDGSVSEVLAAQAWGPEFHSSIHVKLSQAPGSQRQEGLQS